MVRDSMHGMGLYLSLFASLAVEGTSKTSGWLKRFGSQFGVKPRG